MSLDFLRKWLALRKRTRGIELSNDTGSSSGSDNDNDDESNGGGSGGGASPAAVEQANHRRRSRATVIVEVRCLMLADLCWHAFVCVCVHHRRRSHRREFDSWRSDISTCVCVYLYLCAWRVRVRVYVRVLCQ